MHSISYLNVKISTMLWTSISPIFSCQPLHTLHISARWITFYESCFLRSRVNPSGVSPTLQTGRRATRRKSKITSCVENKNNNNNNVCFYSEKQLLSPPATTLSLYVKHPNKGFLALILDTRLRIRNEHELLCDCFILFFKYDEFWPFEANFDRFRR